MSRTTTRIFLGLALLLAIAVIATVLSRSSADFASVGAAIAGALAVITAVISAWGTQRVVELEEDRQKPHAYPIFDFSSRYGLVLFRIENSGGSAAHDISITWHGNPLSSKGKEIRFALEGEEVQIPVLLPGQAISKMVDGHIEFFQGDQRHQYSGTIRYLDPKGRAYSHEFRMDAEMYRGTPAHSDEELKTHFELQKIPKHLEQLECELKKINSRMERDNSNNDLQQNVAGDV